MMNGLSYADCVPLAETPIVFVSVELGARWQSRGKRPEHQYALQPRESP